MTTFASDLLAVLLAAVGSILFGLAAVRQHGVVQESVSDGRVPLRTQLASALRLLRDRSWLVGAAQASLGGGLHVVALALAPITLVQPVGVLAVPVTIVASALKEHRRPSRRQLVGTVLSVLGVAALTVVLLVPPTMPSTLPAVARLATTTGCVIAACAVAVLAATRARPAVRCILRAVAAAVLFGLNSVLIRVVGEVISGTATATPALLVILALVGLAIALPFGVWSMQTAYLSGSPSLVLCCLVLIDPLAAVSGGRVLLQDGSTITGAILLLALACAVVASAGVVLLSRDYPAEPPADLLPVPEPAGSPEP